MLRSFGSILRQRLFAGDQNVGGDDHERARIGQPQAIGGLPQARLLEQPSVQ